MQKKIIFKSLLTLIVVIGLLAGCASPASPPPATPEEPATRVIVDMAGREVTLPAKVESIATFGSIGVINAFVELMGAGGLICNDMSPSFTKNDKWAMQYEFAPQIKGAPVLENADREILIEEVLALQPDLCLTMSKANVEHLEQNGQTVVYLSWSELDDVKTAVTLMGEILGTQNIAEDYISYFDATVDKAAALTSQLSENEKKRVIYGDVVTLSQPHIISEWWLSAAGGVSVTEKAHTEESLTYSMEDLLLWDPEVMLVTADQAEELKANAQLAGITAIKNNSIYLVPTVAHVWGNRNVEQPLTILWALHKMYPELLSTDDLREEIRNFYDRFFEYTMSDEQIMRIIG